MKSLTAGSDAHTTLNEISLVPVHQNLGIDGMDVVAAVGHAYLAFFPQCVDHIAMLAVAYRQASLAVEGLHAAQVAEQGLLQVVALGGVQGDVGKRAATHQHGPPEGGILL